MKASRHGRPPALAEIKFAEQAARLRNRSHKEIFTFINQSNLWGARDSRSGLGSELDATSHIRAEIPKLLEDLKINSVLDLPCGDFGWMRHAKLPINSYIGGDIVESVVSKLQTEFQGEHLGVNFAFQLLDLVNSELPQVDLVLCRDCLVHFSFESIAKAIANLKRSGAKFLLATTFSEFRENIDVHDGDWRPLNLEAAPFHFQRALHLINEQCTEVGGAYADKSLGLWEISKLPGLVE